ncbi:hypothetical protein BBP40_007886 [Aspergillus hancockii]|nr:hypothetical protein BBP40_007886 [Aspergillus hancockii]
MQLLSSSRFIRFGLVVGIGGGVPSNDVHIGLGDIVVSKPTNSHGGVMQYDYGKMLSGERLPTHRHAQSSATDPVDRAKLPQTAAPFARPAEEDCLYGVDSVHVKIDTKSTTCRRCDTTKIISRPLRSSNGPLVHYGLIASANQIVKDRQLHDKLGKELGVSCVETEAAEIMNNFPSLLIRRICDYADSRKNKDW